LATSKNPHSKHPPEITSIVKSVKRAEYYIKKEVWTVLCHVVAESHRKVGSKSKEKHINLRRPFTVGVGEEKPQKSGGYQVTPKLA